MKRILNVILFLLTTLFIWAEEVSFRADAPGQVIVGKPFQLTYTVNQRAKDLRAPEFTNFDILAGPYTSQSSSTSFVNGKRTSSFTLTYTYTLSANKEGSFTISPATIIVDGSTYSSNGVRIKVLPPDQQPTTTSSSSQTSTQSASARTGDSNGEIFVRTIVSKTRVHEQECISLSYRLYFYGVDVAQLTNNTKLPEFQGFLKQDVDQGEIQTELEHYNGRNYQTATIYKTLLFPQHGGDIVIEPALFEAVLRVQNRAQVRSIFDDFFNSYTTVTRALTAPKTTIHVESLPKGKPQGFSGGVGQFSLSSTISNTELSTNEAVTLRLTIQGSGNMKLLKTPAVDWPEGFEVYDPKVDNNFKVSASGVSGTKTIEYLAIPRAGGEYTIPAIPFSYYDVASNAYKTLSTPEYTLHISRGANDKEGTVVANYQQVNKEDIKHLGTDIRYIYTSEELTPHTTGIFSSFGTTTMWTAFAIPLLLCIVLSLVFRRRLKENADVARRRYKKANKVAQKRLKTAKHLMTAENQESAFYEEIERAAYTYLSDRLSIPTAELGKENIAGLLKQKKVSDEMINRVTDLLTKAEFARYAPSLGANRQQLFEQTSNLINDLESEKL